MNIFLFAKKSFNRFSLFCVLWKGNIFLLSSTSYLFIFFGNCHRTQNVILMYLGLERVRATDSPFTVSFLYTLSYSSFLLFQHKNLFKIIFSFFILNFSTLLDYRYHRRISLELHKNTLKLPDFELEKKSEFLKKSF